MKSLSFRSSRPCFAALVFAFAGAGFGFCPALGAQSDTPAPLGANELSRRPVAPGQAELERVRYLGFAAYRLSDGRSEAVIVPALGRVMRYGLVGGANLLWNSDASQNKPGEWRNWGGDRALPAPQSQWPLSLGHDWPPHPSWDGQAYAVSIPAPGTLRLTGGVWPRLGCRVITDFGFGPSGELVIAQTYEKLSGPPVELSIWNIAQNVSPDAIFTSANPQSAYQGGFFWLTKPEISPETVRVSPDLLRIRSGGASGGASLYKIGVDAPLASVVVVHKGLAFRQSAARPAGNYPDGAQGGGFPVEVFDIGGSGPGHYTETELLSPLRTFFVGSRWTHSVRWSLHPLNNQQVDTPECAAQVKVLMGLS